MINAIKRFFGTPKVIPVSKAESTATYTLEQLLALAKWDSPAWGGAQTYIPTARLMEDAYSTHPIVQAAIDLIAGTAPVPRLEVGTWMDGTWKAQEGHPALDLLRTPNPDQSLWEFLYEFTVKSYSGGAGYIWKIQNKSGSRLVELRALPTSWVTAQRPLRGLKLADYYQVSGQDAVVMPTDMIEMRSPSPSDMVSSVGPLVGAWTEIRSDLERAQYFAEMLVNLKIPGIVLKTKRGARTKDEQDAFLRMIENRIGRGKRGSPLTLQPDEDLDFKNPLGDLDWPGLMATSESRICAVLGVPPLLIQSRIGLEKATYSNAEQMSRNFYKVTMSRYWTRLAAVLTRGLLRDSRLARGSASLEFRFAYDVLPEFREDENAKTQRLLMLAQGSVLTIGEVREELGWPPLKEVYKQDAQSDGDTENNQEQAEPATQTAEPVANTKPTQDVQQMALNGAQVASLLQIAQAVADSTLPKDSALLVMEISFPNSDPDKLRGIVDGIDASRQDLRDNQPDQPDEKQGGEAEQNAD